MLYKVTPMLPSPAPKQKTSGVDGRPPRKRRASAIFDGEGHEVLITLMCLKCRTVKPLMQFGLRKMADGAIRNQPWCRPCRSGAGVKGKKEVAQPLSVAPALPPLARVAQPLEVERAQEESAPPGSGRSAWVETTLLGNVSAHSVTSDGVTVESQVVASVARAERLPTVDEPRATSQPLDMVDAHLAEEDSPSAADARTREETQVTLDALPTFVGLPTGAALASEESQTTLDVLQTGEPFYPLAAEGAPEFGGSESPLEELRAPSGPVGAVDPVAHVSPEERGETSAQA